MDQEFGYIILTGGKSSRMGTPKQDLPWGGKSFLQRMEEKAAALGAAEVLLSGGGPREGKRVIEDHYPGAGPLGGIHACLKAASRELNLVVSVDLPQLPAAVLQGLLNKWTPQLDCLLLQNGLQPEPLISLWHKRAEPILEHQLKNGSFSVIRAAHLLHYAYVPYQGDPLLIESCNTPPVYKELLRRLSPADGL